MISRRRKVGSFYTFCVFFLRMLNQGERTSTAVASPSASLGIPGQNEFLATGHLLTGLKGRTISSGLFTALGQAAQFALNFGSITILARLLTPQDFGLVAMVSTIIGFLRIFNDAGLSTATVQREDITHAQISNLFWTNVALGALVSLILAFSAPAVAWFYQEPRLLTVTLALCVTFLLMGSTVQHLALLKRQMRFKMIALIQTSAAAAGVLTGIVMASLNCGYWSLVGMQLVPPLVIFLFTWLVSGWRPQLPKRSSGTRSLLGFGVDLTASGFLWSLARGSDALLIGRYYGSASLGFYSRASALLARPLEQAMAPLDAVFVPTLSRLQGQPERYRRVMLQIFETIVVVSFLFTGLLLALARPLTLFVLGPQWEGAAPIFAGFTIVALYMPIVTAAGWLITSQGRGKHLLVISVISSSVTILAFLAGLPFGPAVMAVAYSASCLLVLLPVTFRVAGKCGPVTTRDLWARFLTHLPLWGIVCGATWVAHRMVDSFPPWMQLAVCAPIGLLAGAVFIWVYAPARRVAVSLLDALRPLLSKVLP